MVKEMMINAVEGQECRIAVLYDGALEELHVERASNVSRVGNIYKGRVTNVEASIQAAFVDFGADKNGFLHISDLHPSHFSRGAKSPEAVGRKRAHRDRPPIQDCLRRGQEVVVQMTKEGMGTKGPTMTTYLSIPGRLLVMMPGMSRLGVSRKIEDDTARDQLRKVLDGIELPPDMGFIVRTAGAGRAKRDIQRDLSFLTRLWKQVEKQMKTLKAPAEVYRESDLITRILRDVYGSDIGRIVCDSASVARRAREFLDVAMPRGKHVIEVYTGRNGLFHDSGVEDQIQKVYARRVEMASGGSVIFDQTEALVAIDVNSGRFRDHSDAETTATKTNLEAAEMIARQLRLRDLGGEIVIDFIDMREDRNRRAVERRFREAIKPDRAKTKILRISQLGIVEMTRQRVRPSLEAGAYRSCACCDGTGMVKTEEAVSLGIMRDLPRAAAVDGVAKIEIAAGPAVAHYLANFQRQAISDLEARTGVAVIVRSDEGVVGDKTAIACFDARGASVTWEDGPAAGAKKGKLATTNVCDIEAPVIAPEAAEPPPAKGQDGEPPDTPEQAEDKKAKKRRPRRRAGRSKKPTDAESEVAEPAQPKADPESPAESEKDKAPAEDQAVAKKPRRRRRPRGRRGGKGPKPENGQEASPNETPPRDA